MLLLRQLTRHLGRTYSTKGYQRMPLLTETERKELLAPLIGNGWSHNVDTDYISKRFLFKDFKEAWRFMGLVADEAELRNHHPEWSNCYNRVDISFSTHDVGGLTRRDVDMATAADQADGKTKAK